LSLQDIIDKSFSKGKILFVDSGASESLEFHKNHIFYKVQVTEYQSDGNDSKMIQFIDISTSILYDLEKAENKFLSLINAFISHELRNPLNSIVAQNMQKRYYYERL
jgi:signal transduction histidine kinase